MLWDWNLKVAMTPYGLLGWNRVSKKNNFSGSENLFFRHCLDCFQSTQNQYVVFSPITWWKLSGASAAHILVCAVWLWKIVFSRSPWTMKWNEPFLRGLQGSSQALRKKHFFATWKLSFWHCPCETHWQARLCNKKIRLWQIVFSHAPG